MSYIKRFILIICIIFITSCSGFVPKKEYNTDALNFIALSLINSYRQDISPADGARSGSYPTGSAYGRQAFIKYGFWAGLIITSDRLVHEIQPNKAYLISFKGIKRKHDPLSFNSYWWDKSVKNSYLAR
ncbi:MAG: membrane protein insertion efficiency factor YidD [SAR324 cluster bacterium]|nr:membrane protein insertion efficiency factor YidD [SAR324 cluster bacterium]